MCEISDLEEENEKLEEELSHIQEEIDETKKKLERYESPVFSVGKIGDTYVNCPGSVVIGTKGTIYGSIPAARVQ